MNPVKVIWTKKDNFDTIHKKLLDLVDKKVIGRKVSEYSIFRVGKIHKTFMECTFSFEHEKRVEKHFSDSMSDTTGFGFPEPTKKSMWGFKVEFGHGEKEGKRTSCTYYFMIPRTNNYKADLKKCGIMQDINHPFIFYNL